MSLCSKFILPRGSYIKSSRVVLALSSRQVIAFVSSTEYRGFEYPPGFDAYAFYFVRLMYGQYINGNSGKKGNEKGNKNCQKNMSKL
jgi:hypothetical protein